MPHETIDGVPIWYEDHGDPDGPPLVALHGGIVTFKGSFGDVLPWLTQGHRVIGVELQGHGHTPDTGRAMSIELRRRCGRAGRPRRGRRTRRRVGLHHAAEMLDLFPDCRLAVLASTRHTEVMQRSDVLRPLIQPFLA
jgi:pimeloyl-ACP methyl ester carboxylesterase